MGPCPRGSRVHGATLSGFRPIRGSRGRGAGATHAGVSICEFLAFLGLLSLTPDGASGMLLGLGQVCFLAELSPLEIRVRH